MKESSINFWKEAVRLKKILEEQDNLVYYHNGHELVLSTTKQIARFVVREAEQRFKGLTDAHKTNVILMGW